MPGKIRIDEGFIREVQAKLTQTRNEISRVKSGVNPLDAGHTHGGHLNDLHVRAGGEKFEPGQSLATKVNTMGTRTDERLTSFDQKLSSYAQGLGHILASSDDTEAANSSYAAFNSYLGGSGPSSNSVPPPLAH